MLKYRYPIGITVVIGLGALAERGRLVYTNLSPKTVNEYFYVRLLPSVLLMLCWTIIVYNPIAHWTWGDGGWYVTNNVEYLILLNKLMD